MLQANDDAASSGHCLPGVHEHVEKNLLNLVPVGENRRHLLGKHLDPDMVFVHFPLQEEQGIREELLEVGWLQSVLAFAGHSENGLGDLGPAKCRIENGLKGLLSGGIVFVAETVFCPVDDRRENVIELMCCCANEFAQGRIALGVG